MTLSPDNRIVRARNATPTSCGSTKVRSVGRSHAHRTVLGICWPRELTSTAAAGRERAALNNRVIDAIAAKRNPIAINVRLDACLFISAIWRSSLHHANARTEVFVSLPD